MIPQYATIGEMQAWAADVMASRVHDFAIGPNAADPHIRRWWLVPRNEHCNVYLHEIRHSDDDRALHDHPWANTSLVVAGGYFEHTPDGVHWREPGQVVTRDATALHRLVLLPGETAISLFMTGPKVRDWGFDCPQGRVRWQDFVDPTNPGQPGRGCGE